MAPGENDPVAAPVTVRQPKRGTPGFYPVGKRADGTLALDRGFKVYPPLAFRPAPTFRQLAAGDIARAGAGDSLARAPDATKAGLYPDRTTAVRSGDGNTLAVTVELPPVICLHQKLRLRGLNCPEMDTATGQAAKRSVQSLVTHSSDLAIATTKPDKYDRCLADVFLLGIEASPSGVKTNRSAGLAPRVELTPPGSLLLNHSLLLNGSAVHMSDAAQPVVGWRL